jgi:hypothetical protein
VGTLVDNEHFLVEAGGKPFGEDAASEAGADNEVIKHG